MPKNMFFNIKEDKRNKFLEVAFNEFTSKSFEEVSVNTIVKKANISRGSFYTYFEDLEELFNYVFEDVRNQRFEYAKKLLKECKGDYFTFVKTLFAYDYDNYSESGKYSLFRNYVHYVQKYKKAPLKANVFLNSYAVFSEGETTSNVFNMDKLNISEDDLMDLIEVVFILMMDTYIKSENEDLTKKEAIELFDKRISFIENGVRKK